MPAGRPSSPPGHGVRPGGQGPGACNWRTQSLEGPCDGEALGEAQDGSSLRPPLPPPHFFGKKV